MKLVSSRDFDDLEARVIAMVAHQTGHKRDRIEPDTWIESELGCTGDDARELMEILEHEFRIDMTGMDISRHFDAEGARGWPFLVALVVAVPVSVLAMMALGLTSMALGWGILPIASPGLRFLVVYLASFLLVGFSTTLVPHARARRARKIPLNVQHLIDAARTKKWPFSSMEGQTQ